MSDPTALPNFPPPPDEHPLRGRFLDILQDMGLAPNVDNDGDVAFQANDQQLFIRIAPSELDIFRLFGQWHIEESLLGDEDQLLQTCNEVNLALNLAKTALANNTLVVTSEHLVTQGADLALMLQIATQAVLQGVHIWHQHINGIDPLTGQPREMGDDDE